MRLPKRPNIRSRSAGVPAFTLIEMLVSLAVVSVALTVVGVVFSVTTRAVSQAAALSEVQARVRQFALQFKEDFRFVDPSRSVLVLAGRTQSAALSQDDLAADKRIRYLVGDPFDPKLQGYDPAGEKLDDNEQYSNPRADVIATFSLRPWASQAPSLNAGPNDQYASGAKFTPIQVVYGHAAFGTTKLNNGLHVWANKLTHIETDDPKKVLSPLPTQRWHLGRRAAILQFVNNSRRFRIKWSPKEFKRIVRCEAANNEPGDAIEFSLDTYLTWMSSYATEDPYRIRGKKKKFLDGANDLIYPGGKTTNHHVMSLLEEPPADLRTNVGLHLLPGCGWFQVEFLMPEDPRNSRDYVDPTGTNRRDDMPRWVEVPPGETFVFVADTAENREKVAKNPARFATFAQVNPPPPRGTGLPTVKNKRIRLWPYAIRVTIRVYDPRGRLTVPVVRTIVHRFD